MCGLCLPHCPTYNKTQDEAESPRGRISLILALANNQLEPDEQLRAHLDNCLLCRSCESVCPSGVQFGEIMDGALGALQADRSSPEQAIDIGQLALDKKQQRRQAQLLWAADKTGLRRLGRGLGISKAMGMERFEQLAPSIARPHDWPEYIPTKGEHRGDVALFTGCFGDMFDQATLDSAVQVLTACGYGIHIPKTQACCGALHQHCGDRAQAQQLGEQNLAAFAELDIEAVISCASGCGSHLSEYQKHLGQALPVQDISQFLAVISWPESVTFRPLKQRISVHEPCSLRNVLKQQSAAYSLLARIPELTVEALTGNDQCCGAAGSYMIDHPEMADQLRADKLIAIHQANIDILVSSNIGCSLHIAAGLRQKNKKIEVVHPVTVLARQLVS